MSFRLDFYPHYVRALQPSATRCLSLSRRRLFRTEQHWLWLYTIYGISNRNEWISRMPNELKKATAVQLDQNPQWLTIFLWIQLHLWDTKRSRHSLNEATNDRRKSGCRSMNFATDSLTHCGGRNLLSVNCKSFDWMHAFARFDRKVEFHLCSHLNSSLTQSSSAVVVVVSISQESIPKKTYPTVKHKTSSTSFYLNWSRQLLSLLLFFLFSFLCWMGWLC